MQNYPQNAQPGTYQPPQVQGARQWPHMTMGNWLVTYLMMLIPIANIVLMFVWAFGSNVNPSKKAFFRAALLMAAIGIVLSIVFGVLFGSLFQSLGNFITYSIS